MHLRLLPWLLFLAWHWAQDVVGSQHPRHQPPSAPSSSPASASASASRVRRQGRMHRNMSQPCPRGCATCSEYNGCITCKSKLFFHLERRDMKQIGMCVSSCPPGHVGQRSPERNECTKCKDDCEACFNKNFCMKCKNGFYLHHGKCLENCPDWLEPNNHTMECNNIVHCKVNEWSEWSFCTRRGKTCGFKRGNETRVRTILQLPSTKGRPCPHTSEKRKCVVERKKCQKEMPGRRKERRKKPKREESKETSQENRGSESRQQNRERENKRKTQSKKRRAQDKQQKLAPISTAH